MRIREIQAVRELTQCLTSAAMDGLESLNDLAQAYSEFMTDQPVIVTDNEIDSDAFQLGARI